MKIVITAGEAINRGVWLEICELKGINEWAIKEGLMDSNHELELTEEEAREVSLI